MGIRSFVPSTLIVTIACTGACGGNHKKVPDKPSTHSENGDKLRPPPAHVETEAEREHKRRDAVLAIVPEGGTCLPASFKDNGAPRLDVAAVGNDAILCATDTDKTRLLGPIACWKIDLNTGALTYQDPAPLPGHDIDVRLDDRCARGYCLPKDAKLPDDKVVHMSWNLTGSKVAVLTADDVHLFDGASKNHESAFSIRGDKGAVGPTTGVSFLDDYVVVEAGEGPAGGVWVYKADGTAGGPVSAVGATGNTPLSTFKGSLLLLNGVHIGVAEQGFSTVTEQELDNGRRTKLVRKVNKPACKPEELTEYWKDGDRVTDRCRDAMAKSYEHLIGASGLEGAHSFLMVLRGPRLGELGVLDLKTLAEKKAIKLPWCADGQTMAPTTTPPPGGAAF